MKEARKILKEIRNGRFSISRHARTRMAQRMITREDIISVARTCFEQTWQEGRATYRFMGYFVDGDKGGVAVTYRGGVIVVTVLDRRKGR